MKQLPDTTSTIINELFDYIESKNLLINISITFYNFIFLNIKYLYLKTNIKCSFIDIIRNNNNDLFNGNKVSFYFSVLENLLCASDGIKKIH